MASHKAHAESRRPGRREQRKHLTRRELLAAGRRLFAEKGLYDSRIEDLTRQAGIAKGTLYGYFANKEELIEAVVTNGFSELLGHVHRAAQGAGSRDQAVARVGEAHLVFFAENPDLMRVFHQVRGLLKFDRVESRPLRRVLANYLIGLEQVLRLRASTRAARNLDGLSVAMVLFGAASGVTSVYAAIHGGAPSPAASKAVQRALVALVRTFESPLANGAARAVHPRRWTGPAKDRPSTRERVMRPSLRRVGRG